MPVKIVVIDYGMGNLRSIRNKFMHMGIPAVISFERSEIENADKLILPGVGHFSTAMNNLRQLNLIELLNDKVLCQKTPILGICLGMQLLAKSSEEGFCEGLGWIDASVKRFSVSDTQKFKIPHIGWNSVDIKKKTLLFSNIQEDSFFYFVHSYYMVCHSSEDVLTTSVYDYEFASSVQKDNIFGTQFHPEKSFEQGELMLKNFAMI